MERLRILRIAYLAICLLVFSQCSSTKWVDQSQETESKSPPGEIAQIFEQYPESIMTIQAQCPGYDYDYDIAEKDQLYDLDSNFFKFENIEIKLHKEMPQGMVLVDIDFLDSRTTKASVKNLDLMRLIPSFETTGDLSYSELIQEEFNRFGLSFRKEHKEFELSSILETPEYMHMEERAYRMSITNNCLEPTKWEMALVTEDYSDFSERMKGDVNINQNKLLSHSWFYLNDELYNALIKLKNPDLEIDLKTSYDTASAIAENVVVDFESLRYPIDKKYDTKILELGHQSGRKLEPVDVEEHYKWQFGLLLNKDELPTYTAVLEKPVQIARFGERGYYNSETPNVYDYSYLKHVDEVVVERVATEDSDCYMQIKLTGEYAPYEIVLGNMDMALFDEQKRTGFLFGYNTYPKSRRYNPQQNTIFYDTDSYPDLLKPYVVLVDKETGKWVNNQKKGVEKVYISYESLNQDVLEIYLLSYERVTPIWMARVKLPTNLREAVRVRKMLYAY